MFNFEFNLHCKVNPSSTLTEAYILQAKYFLNISIFKVKVAFTITYSDGNIKFMLNDQNFLQWFINFMEKRNTFPNYSRSSQVNSGNSGRQSSLVF